MRAIAIAIAIALVAARATPALAAPYSPEADAEAEADALDDAVLASGALHDLPAGTPDVHAVLTAAYAAAGLAHDPTQSWIRRARLSGLVPWLTVRTARDTSWQDDQSEVGHGTTLELRATWRLDRLVFDSRELQVASIEATRRRERRRLAGRVIHTYFSWQRAVEAAAGSDERARIRVAELTAELDVLTDGWFSDELSPQHRGSQRSPKP